MQPVQHPSIQETVGVAWPDCPRGIVQDLAGETQSTVDWGRADKSMMNADFGFSLLSVVNYFSS